jgi:histone deacetylase complex regulatory component SIN3
MSYIIHDDDMDNVLSNRYPFNLKIESTEFTTVWKYVLANFKLDINIEEIDYEQLIAPTICRHELSHSLHELLVRSLREKISQLPLFKMRLLREESKSIEYLINLNVTPHLQTSPVRV